MGRTGFFEGVFKFELKSNAEIGEDTMKREARGLIDDMKKELERAKEEDR